MDELRMSGKERIRIEAFSRVKAGQWTVNRAATACGVEQGGPLLEKRNGRSDTGHPWPPWVLRKVT
jgi:hypothetical protein